MFWEIGFPQRVLVSGEGEAIQLINQNIRYSDIYITLYKYEKLLNERTVDRNSCIVDKIFFDFDSESCLEDIRKLNGELKKENILRELRFSGRGFHLIIYTTGDVTHKKDAVFNTQKHFTDKLNLGTDKQIMGNVAQLIRVKNTYNFKRKRWCVPLTEEDLNLSYNEICELAKKQRFITCVLGEKLFDLSKFDNRNTRFHVENNVKSFINGADVNDDKLIVNGGLLIDMPPFLVSILKNAKTAWNKKNGWTDRRNIILWLREKGISECDCESVLRECLSVEESTHALKVERQVSYIYKRNEQSANPLWFPSVPQLIVEGYKLCARDVEMAKGLYLR